MRWLWAASALAVGGCAGPKGWQPPRYDIRYPPPPDPARVVFLAAINDDVDFGRRPDTLRKLIYGYDNRPVRAIGKPFGLCTWDDQLLVCDTEQHVVHVFDFGSRRMSSFGQQGRVRLHQPVDVKCDAAGLRYVADAGRGEVLIFDRSGQLAGRINPGSEADPFKPVAVAVRGRQLFVVNNAQHRIEVLDAESGMRLATFGRGGFGEGELLFPAGIALDRQGRVYVSDLMNGRVQVFSEAGRFLQTIGGPGDRPGEFAKPKHLAFDDEAGILFVADAGFQQVHMFDGDGRVLMLFGGQADAADAMALPAGICLDRGLLPHFRDLMPAGFEASALVFVSNQYLAPAIGVYAFGRFPEDKPRGIASSTR